MFSSKQAQFDDKVCLETVHSHTPNCTSRLFLSSILFKITFNIITVTNRYEIITVIVIQQ